MIEVTSVTASLRVTVEDRPLPHLSAEILAQVDAIWREERARWGDRIFDNKIFTVRGWSDSEIFGSFVDYRLFYTQLKKPELFPVLNIRPLAVSGLVLTDNGVVFGLRNRSSAQHPGLWELVPSGGIDTETERSEGVIAYEDQLLAEASEELGIPASAVTEPFPFILIHDTNSHAIDIGLFLRTHVSGEEVRRAFEASDNHEYDRLQMVTTEELGHFLAENEPNIVPVSLSMLAAARPMLDRPA
ncbi:hypothetical protein L2D14_08070 [Thalassospiraceae bacterium LMO-JJ14]|nr:hypothetical protein L2D14_08070 [Thalassospiraceae bacterium LMO-JJ14]